MPTRRRPPTLEWEKIFDLDRAISNCKADIIGDWYRDPWGWPEYTWISDTNQFELVTRRLNADGVRRSASIDVAKENFGTRPAIVMDPVDRLVYQGLVDYFSVDLIGDLDPFVAGWRLKLSKPAKGTWADNGFEWERFRDGLGSLADWYSAALKTDVVSCFASIPIESLIERVTELAGTGVVVDRLSNMLRGWDRIPDRGGLPQRSAASAALANMYLRPIDDVLRRRGRPRGSAAVLFPTGTAVRWMDDIWIFANNPATLRGIQIELQEALRLLDLHMNHAKTEVLEGERVAEEAKLLKHSAVEDGLIADPLSEVPLDELIDELLATPEKADRTSVSFVTKRMRDYELFDRVEEFVVAAERMPHCADSLARLFRDSGWYEELVDWYVSYWDSGWSTIPWAKAQFGTMFPSTMDDPGPLVDLFLTVIEGHEQLPLLALAAQRVASWRKKDADVKYTIREAGTRSDHPLHRRILALAGVTAKEARSETRRLLGEFEENDVTLRMLEDVAFRIDVVSDYAGD